MNSVSARHSTAGSKYSTNWSSLSRVEAVMPAKATSATPSATRGQRRAAEAAAKRSQARGAKSPVRPWGAMGRSLGAGALVALCVALLAPEIAGLFQNVWKYDPVTEFTFASETCSRDDYSGDDGQKDDSQ